MRLARRWGIFNAVGLIGFAVQISALSFLTHALGWPAAAATAVGLELAILNNFYWHNRWTFGDRPARDRRGLLARLGRYQAAKTLSMAGNLAITAWLISQVQLPVEAANTIAVLGFSGINFFLSDRVFQAS